MRQAMEGLSSGALVVIRRHALIVRCDTESHEYLERECTALIIDDIHVKNDYYNCPAYVVFISERQAKYYASRDWLLTLDEAADGHKRGFS